MRRLAAALVCGTAFLSGCDNRPGRILRSAPPTAPLPTPPALPLSGVVAAGGKPVAGASVFLLSAEGTEAVLTTSTGPDGTYSFPDINPAACAPRQGCNMAGASKEGYFKDIKWLPVGTQPRIDFWLEPIEYVSVGEPVAREIGHSVCEGLGYGAVHCGRVAIRASSSGTMQVIVTGSPWGFDVDAVLPDGTFAFYTGAGTSGLRFEFPVEEGLTYELRVAQILATARSFELAAAIH